jgi:maleylpyruvate isomerase
VILHGYWRSSAAYRVRIGLALKGVSADAAAHDLRTGDHRSADYLALNPQGLVPALEVEGGVITQSAAILEWLDETHPEPPLLPGDTLGRATVRGMVGLIASDIHPLNNLRVLKRLRAE